MSKKQLLVLSISLLVVIVIINSKAVTLYTQQMTSAFRTVDMSKDDFYQKILSEAEQLREEPIEPRIDSVWKLVPGYDGLEVDVEATYNLANRSTQTFTPIYREVPVEKNLWDFLPQPIYRANPNKEMAAFMINVAWGNEYLPKILDTLAEKNVKATFFLDGSWLNKNHELAQAIVDGGHEIGNHATTHPMMSKLSRQLIAEEIDITNERIKSILGIEANLFAPPSGDFDQRVIEIARERDMLTILWTLDTVDWRKPPVQEMVNKIITNVDNGHLILMHPTEPTAEGMAQMIEGIEAKGLQLGTVSQVISSKRLESIELYGDF